MTARSRADCSAPIKLKAAIAACHATADTPADTAWAQIAGLYERLATPYPSPVVALNRAVAVAMSDARKRGWTWSTNWTAPAC